MRRAILMILVMAIGGGVGACSQSGEERAERPGLYVPSAAIIQRGGSGTGGTALAYGVLPSSDAETLYVGRAEKYVEGPYVMEGSAYSIYTFDQQLISSFWGPSFRNRSVVQQGVTVP